MYQASRQASHRASRSKQSIAKQGKAKHSKASKASNATHRIAWRSTARQGKARQSKAKQGNAKQSKAIDQSANRCVEHPIAAKQEKRQARLHLYRYVEHHSLGQSMTSWQCRSGQAPAWHCEKPHEKALNSCGHNTAAHRQHTLTKLFPRVMRHA